MYLETITVGRLTSRLARRSIIALVVAFFTLLGCDKARSGQDDNSNDGQPNLVFENDGSQNMR